MIRLLMVAALCASAIGTARAQDGKAVVERDKVDLAPADGVEITRVAIDNRFGEVSVIGHDAPGLTIIAVKRAPDDATMDRLKVSLVPDPNGPVAIGTSLLAVEEARPIAAGSIRIDLLVYAPRSARVAATTWNGAVALESLDNGAEVTTNEGDIRVKTVSGDIETHAAQGKQEFREVFGELEAEGLLGEMSFQTVKGARLAAVMHEGPIRARQVRAREVTLRTTHGDIDLVGQPVPGGSVRIAAHRGDVRVTFEEGTAFRVAALARRGTVVASGFEVERRGARAVGHYGGGREPARVSVSTHVGNIAFNLEVGVMGEPAPGR